MYSGKNVNHNYAFKLLEKRLGRLQTQVMVVKRIVNIWKKRNWAVMQNATSFFGRKKKNWDE